MNFEMNEITGVHPLTYEGDQWLHSNEPTLVYEYLEKKEDGENPQLPELSELGQEYLALVDFH